MSNGYGPMHYVLICITHLHPRTEVTLRIDSRGHLQALASKMSQQGSKDATYVCTSLRVCICVRSTVCMYVWEFAAHALPLANYLNPCGLVLRAIVCVSSLILKICIRTDSPVPILIMSAGVINL